jgi:lambda family phage portal protein
MNLLDRAIGYINPKAGAERAANRRKIALLEGARGYEAASLGRLSRNRRVTSSNADAAIGKGGRALRDRSRDLVRNNSLAAKIVTAHANNIVGFGITPRANTGSDTNNKKVNDLFTAWSKVCISGHAMDFHGAVYLMARLMVQDGEGYVRKRLRKPEDGLPVPLQLQILDSEFCDWGRCGVSADANTLVQGIEFDPIGNRRGYWMWPQNPKANIVSAFTELQSKFVPAADVAHFYEPQNNQVHGVPWLSPVMNDLDELKDYETSENVRKKIESCMVGMVIPAEGDTDNPNIGLTEPAEGQEVGDPEDGPPPAAVRDIYGFPLERMEPGMFGVLAGGKDIRFNTPAISAGIEAYIRTRHRCIAAGARLPYELLTGDFSQSNFASGKLGLLEYQRFVMVVQWHYLIPQVLQIVWDWFVEAAKDAGKIPRSWNVGVEWNPPEVESITRLDDARADLLEVRMGKRSMPEIISRTGRAPGTVLKEINDWNADVDKMPTKVVLDSDPRKVANNGQFQMAAGDNGDGNAAGQR